MPTKSKGKYHSAPRSRLHSCASDKAPQGAQPPFRIYTGGNQVCFKLHDMNPPLVYNPYISSAGKIERILVPQFKSYLTTKVIETEVPTLCPWDTARVVACSPVCCSLQSPAKKIFIFSKGAGQSSSEKAPFSCRKMRRRKVYKANDSALCRGKRALKISARCTPFSTEKWSPPGTHPSPTTTRMENYKEERSPISSISQIPLVPNLEGVKLT